jgi:hypothetical protein
MLWRAGRRGYIAVAKLQRGVGWVRGDGASWNRLLVCSESDGEAAWPGVVGDVLITPATIGHARSRGSAKEG